MTMSGFSIFDISGRAMSAQLVRLNTTASNLASLPEITTSLNNTLPSVKCALEKSQPSKTAPVKSKSRPRQEVVAVSRRWSVMTRTMVCRTSRSLGSDR